MKVLKSKPDEELKAKEKPAPPQRAFVSEYLSHAEPQEGEGDQGGAAEVAIPRKVVGAAREAASDGSPSQKYMRPLATLYKDLASEQTINNLRELAGGSKGSMDFALP